MTVIADLRRVAVMPRDEGEMRRRGLIGCYEARLESGKRVKVFMRRDGTFTRSTHREPSRNPTAARPTAKDWRTRETRRSWLSSKIATLREEGYPGRQAIAVAYTELRDAMGKAGRRVPADLTESRSAPKKDVRLERAIELYTAFREEHPEYLQDVPLPADTVGVVMGRCLAVRYETTINGKTEKYEHEFSGSAAPLLVSGAEGKQLYLLGGWYRVGPRGIVDKRG